MLYVILLGVIILIINITCSILIQGDIPDWLRTLLQKCYKFYSLKRQNKF